MEQFPARVWVVERTIQYEGSDVDSIWSTPELANARWKALMSIREAGGPTFSTTWYSIDKVD